MKTNWYKMTQGHGGEIARASDQGWYGALEEGGVGIFGFSVLAIF